MLLAFLALIAMFDAGIGWLGTHLMDQKWSLGALLGWVFWPIAWCMGIPYEDCSRGGELLGLKMVANEFVAYERLGQWKQSGEVTLQPRTIVIMSYALCGFSNFGSIGIQIGGIGAMAPERRGELASLGLRAMLGGTLACCMTGCVAGFLIGDHPIELDPRQPTAPATVPADSNEQKENPSEEKSADANKNSDPSSEESTKRAVTIEPTESAEPNDSTERSEPTNDESATEKSAGLFQTKALGHQFPQCELPDLFRLVRIDQQHDQIVGSKFG